MKTLRNIVPIDEGKRFNTVKKLAKDYRLTGAGIAAGAGIGALAAHALGEPMVGSAISNAGFTAGWVLDARRNRLRDLKKQRKVK